MSSERLTDGYLFRSGYATILFIGLGSAVVFCLRWPGCGIQLKICAILDQRLRSQPPSVTTSCSLLPDQVPVIVKVRALAMIMGHLMWVTRIGCRIVASVASSRHAAAASGIVPPAGSHRRDQCRGWPPGMFSTTCSCALAAWFVATCPASVGGAAVLPQAAARRPRPAASALA